MPSMVMVKPPSGTGETSNVTLSKSNCATGVAITISN